MSYYFCLGKTNYYSTMPSKPQYGLGSKKFNDFFDYFQGYAKTPQELGLVYPFPQQYTDSQGRVWVLQQGEVPDNHQFNRKREISFQNQVYYKVRNKEKYQDPKPKWDSQSAQTPSLLSQLKKKNLIGQ